MGHIFLMAKKLNQMLYFPTSLNVVLLFFSMDKLLLLNKNLGGYFLLFLNQTTVPLSKLSLDGQDNVVRIGDDRQLKKVFYDELKLGKDGMVNENASKTSLSKISPHIL